MDIESIKKALAGNTPEHITTYCGYINSLLAAKNKKTKGSQNPWMAKRPDEYFVSAFKKVAIDGLVFDGVHITLQSTGISYDYIAFKNKMFLAYPESVVDVGLVYKADEFVFEKKSGSVGYVHKIGDPFGQTEADIVGGYCVIKNKRGDFLTLLNRADIDKHRKVAKTDYIWKSWFAEMALKTVIKKACKQHFADIFQNIETVDNENYDVELPLDIDVETKAEIEKITTKADLTKYYMDHKKDHPKNTDAFHGLITKRLEQINTEATK